MVVAGIEDGSLEQARPYMSNLILERLEQKEEA